MSAEPVIVTRGLTKYFGQVPGLIDLDLSVQPGEVYGFLGPNGAGKTTMIRAILDEIRPTAGQAWIMGMDSRRESVEIRRHIGYLPGDLKLYPRLTGRQTLEFFANLRGGVEWSYVQDLADRLGSDLDRTVGDLSTGNRQKVGLIQAFMNRPDLLIMDEPSSGLDPLMQRELQAMMREMAAEGGTVFLSSHTLSEVQRVADRVAIIRRGRLVAVDTLDDLRTKALRRIEIECAGAIDERDIAAVAGASDLTVKQNQATFAFAGRMAELLQRVTERYEVLDITTSEPDLEEIFLTFYRDDTDPADTLSHEDATPERCEGQ